MTGLISQLISTVDASLWTSGLVAAIVVAAVVVVRNFGAAPAPAPSCTTSDSWCNPQEPGSAGAGHRNHSASP